ncbi:FAD-dependent oxidoreductase [Aliirhizobium cellulosilyticum]|uniref:Thioredoxin reductase n=1 Tax=Aliirhizobium cellulosilyticum TaxID=393664 RepID=A0A7W6Y2J9_9HYPH|nr:FAD-dependent oxidoreductase [Rhizobium cellulosilyticum]MBB4349373.1 thioredoxin reductase (NADPH) [Rhizobium cellulosilyticum]MBB4412405.1 thioredoxin reductase (NADPH) [Rhizobium cellulosilyticum]MBB4447037.1 thioredoxin reductase (NADPH) [Rhizobium cellulosilyticum]
MANSASFETVYPVLDKKQIEVAQRFASEKPRLFQSGETLFFAGERDAPAWLVVEGQLEIIQRAGVAGEQVITRFGPGQFSGEVSQLSGYPALVSGRAGASGCSAIPFNASHVRAMLIGAAELGEIVMRAFILRRANLVANGGSGCVLVGKRESSQLIHLEGFLRRNGYPYTVLNSAPGGDGAALVERLGFTELDLPLMVCPSGEVLRSPNEAAAAQSLGITAELDSLKTYDVAIVGAGPAGLAAAVYAGSEGLSVVVLEEAVAGGQAGASMRIENYLGFPEGITGQALMERALNQALKFGAAIVLPLAVKKLKRPDKFAGTPYQVLLANGDVVITKTVVIATGARYRKPDIPNLSKLESSGISYWVSPIEGQICSGEDVVLVGGGNSAGQAVVYLAPQVRRLRLVVRRPLEETMSAYLIDRISALKNVELQVDSEVKSLATDQQGRLEFATVQNIKTYENSKVRLSHLFLFIGADPNSDWLPVDLSIDDRGFIKTGMDVARVEFEPAELLSLETSMPNVFAIGDIRSGSTKRVAAAVGEGAMVVSQIHQALKRTKL